MSNPNKERGTRWEGAVRAVMNAFFRRRYGLKVYRPAQEGYKDTGDLHGVSPFILQAKDWKDVVSALREGLNGAVVQAKHAGEAYGVAVVKRARRPTADAYAILRLQDLSRVIIRLRRAEALLEALAPEAYSAHAAETALDLAEDFPRA